MPQGIRLATLRTRKEGKNMAPSSATDPERNYARVGIFLGGPGLTLIYGILHIPNFAHGHKYMLAAFTSLFFVTNYHTNYWVSLVLAMAILGRGWGGGGALCLSSPSECAPYQFFHRGHRLAPDDREPRSDSFRRGFPSVPISCTTGPSNCSA